MPEFGSWLVRKTEKFAGSVPTVDQVNVWPPVVVHPLRVLGVRMVIAKVEATKESTKATAARMAGMKMRDGGGKEGKFR
jgi:hypothetical protein